MPRRKFSDKRRATIPEGLVEFLRSGKVAKGDLETFLARSDPEKLATAWAAVGADLTAECVKRSPGTRPYFWWIAEGGLRLRVGGIGTPWHEAFTNKDISNPKPRYRFGIPQDWLSAREVNFWLRQGRIIGKAFDESDPPKFESEAAYLKRLNLFLPGEERRVPEAAWEPEVIT